MTPKLFLALFLIIFPVFMIAISIISVKKLRYYTSVKSKRVNLESGSQSMFDIQIFEDIGRKLKFHGFEYDDDYKIDIEDMGISGFTRRFIHKELATEATIGYMKINLSENLKSGKQVIKALNKYTFKILTNFEDEYRVLTRDGNDVYLLKEENILINEIKKIGDINESISKHLNQVKGILREKPLRLIDENKDYGISLKEEFESVYEKQIGYGILKYCSNESCYKFTRSGIIQGAIIYIKASFKSPLNGIITSKNPFVPKTDITLIEKGNPSDIASKFLRVARFYIILIVITFLLRWISPN